MTEWPDTEQLLERFRHWIYEVREASRTGESSALTGTSQGVSDLASESGPADIGLVDVVREFTALRHEVKLQTKSARGLEEQAAAAFAALDEASRQFRAIEPKEAEAAHRAALPLIELLADLDESLSRAHAFASKNLAATVEPACERLGGDSPGDLSQRIAKLYAAQPAWKRWLCREWHARVCELCQLETENEQRIVNSMADGYLMVRKRLERAMGKEGLYRLTTEGLPVDPHTMTVVEVVEDSGLEAGTVVEEIRPGYRWNDKIVRFAEVRAARPMNPNLTKPNDNCFSQEQK